MTPQAKGFDVDPVLELSAVPPLPKSSSSSLITTALPTTPLGCPARDMSGSISSSSEFPSSLTSMLPKSPTCLTGSLGPPC